MARTRFDERLVRQAQGGDRKAQDELLRRLERVLRPFFRGRAGDTSFVDDLVQNTLLRVHNGLEALRSPGAFKGFAMKAAFFELNDLYRGRYGPKEALYEPAMLVSSAVSQSGQEGSRVDAERALSVLSPHARRIMELREYGYKYREIASMLGTTEMAVKMQVKRAFDRMRRALAD